MDYYVEISSTYRHNVPPYLVHVEDTEGLTGFRSVYQYPVKTCQWVMQNWSEKYGVFGSVNGMVAAGLPVATDRLFIDFDDDPESADKFIAWFRKHNISHSVWDSGGRSVHLHVVTKWACSPHLPYSQKRWLQELGEVLGASADYSIYHAAGLFRLPDTVHEKTGRKKEQIGGLWGDVLDIPVIEPAHERNSEASLTSFWRMMLSPVPQGGRHFHVYKLASNASKLGMPPEEVLEHLRHWNKWQDVNNRLTEEDLETKMYKSI